MFELSPKKKKKLMFEKKWTFRPRLGEENGMERKWMKRIISEYSSIPLFGSLNGREWNG